MIVDPSVITAILLREPEGEHFRAVLEKHGALMSAPSYLELAIVLASKGVSNAGPTLDAILSGVLVSTSCRSRLTRPGWPRKPTRDSDEAADIPRS